VRSLSERLACAHPALGQHQEKATHLEIVIKRGTEFRPIHGHKAYSARPAARRIICRRIDPTPSSYLTVSSESSGRLDMKTWEIVPVQVGRRNGKVVPETDPGGSGSRCQGRGCTRRARTGPRASSGTGAARPESAADFSPSWRSPDACRRKPAGEGISGNTVVPAAPPCTVNAGKPPSPSAGGR